MIKIKLIKNILDKNNRQEFSVEYSESQSIADILKSKKIKMLDHKIIVNGVREFELNKTLPDNSSIIVIPDINNSDIYTGIAVAGLVALGGFGVVGAWAFWSAGMIGINWIAAKISPKPNYGKSTSSSSVDDSSPTYGWDGIENTQDVGIPIGVIYGENRVGGNIINLSLKQSGSSEMVFFTATSGTDYTDSGWVESYTSGGARYYKRDLKSLLKINAFALGFLSGVTQWVTVYYKKTSESSFNNSIAYNLIYNRAYTLQSDELDYDFYDIQIVITSQAVLQFVNFGILQSIPEEFSQKLNVLLGLGEGEVEQISDIQIDDNPITNYEKATFAARNGLNNQSIIAGFENLNNFFQINSKLLKNIKYNYTTINNNINGFEINLTFPYGIWSTNDSGDFNQWSVNLKVEYKLSTSETWIDNGTTVVNYKTKDVYRKVITVSGLAAGRYDIRVSKLTDDPDNQYYYGECDIVNINEFIERTATYPNTALLGVTIPASEQISSNIPTITSYIKGLKVLAPQIKDSQGNLVGYDDYYYDSENNAYKLISDGSVLTYDSTLLKQYSANPIWCLYDFLTNKRYGAGNFISADDIDIENFKSLAKYCDTLAPGTYDADDITKAKKRLRLDIVIDSITQVIDIISNIALSFKGFVFFSEGKIKAVIDKPEIVTQMFTMGNIIEGSFKETIKSHKEKYNTIEVTYYDRTNNYKQDIVVVEDIEDIELNGVKKTSVRVFANDEDYAILYGKYILKVSQLIDKTVSFSAAVDAVMCQPGDIIAVVHDNNSFIKSGRIVSYSSGVCVIDCDMPIELNKQYTIVIRLSDDTIVKKSIKNINPETTRNILVDDDFTPEAGNIFALYESTESYGQYKVMNMRRTEDLDIEISAIEYNEAVYDEEIDVVTVDEENIYTEDGQRIIVDRI